VLPLWPLGLRVSEKIIHRLPLFCVLSGAKAGDILTFDHLVRVITGVSRDGLSVGKGLFASGRGKKILFLNQIEDEAGLEQAQKLILLLSENFRTGLAGIIAGSVQHDSIFSLTP
jgi:probable selenium-dependent hydroxylase accessory protein YqeC